MKAISLILGGFFKGNTVYKTNFILFQINHEEGNSNPIELSDASFSWTDSALSLNECSLQNVTWEVSEGSLVAVVGTVGSGKSSLLSALLGDMIRVRGEANIKGKIAYVPQQAWMQNATLKNNILFGRDYQKELYEKVSIVLFAWIPHKM